MIGLPPIYLTLALRIGLYRTVILQVYLVYCISIHPLYIWRLRCMLDKYNSLLYYHCPVDHLLVVTLVQSTYIHAYSCYLSTILSVFTPGLTY